MLPTRFLSYLLPMALPLYFSTIVFCSISYHIETIQLTDSAYQLMRFYKIGNTKDYWNKGENWDEIG